MSNNNTRNSARRFGVGKTNAFDVFNIIFFILLAFIMLYPFWSVLMSSLVTAYEHRTRAFIFWPRNPTLDSYRFIFITDRFTRSFFVTVFVTIMSTFYTLAITTTCAYALTKKSVPGYRIFIAMLTITMFFGGGLIPYFMLIRDLGLNNTLAPLIVGSMSFFNFVIIRAFITQIPDGLEESAVIDGANEVTIFFRLILPLSVPVIAVIALWTAVGAWNAFFNAMLFLTGRPDLHTLQLVLRQLVVQREGIDGAEMAYRMRFGHDAAMFSHGIQMAAVVVVTTPILLVYPFLQKYFVKGIYLGAMKG